MARRKPSGCGLTGAIALLLWAVVIAGCWWLIADYARLVAAVAGSLP